MTRVLRSGPVVVAAAGAYAVVVGAFALLQHRAFRSGWDLAIFTQYVSRLGHAADPFNTLNGRFLLGDHVEPGLALLAPIGAVGHVAPLLLVLQSLALAAVAPLLYLVSRRMGAEPRLAAIVPLLWLVSPVALHPALYDFHPDTLAAAFVAASALAAVSGRPVLFAVLAALACSFREDVALVYVGAGIVLLLYRRLRAGIALTAIALAYYVLCIYVILPAFGSAVRTDFGPRYAGNHGRSFFDLIRYDVKHPVNAVADALSPTDLGILFMLALTTGGLCILAPRWLIPAAPLLVINFLSQYGNQHTLDFHYYVVVMTAVAVAGAVGAETAQRLGPAIAIRVAVGSGVLLLLLSLGVLRTSRQVVAAANRYRADRAAAVAAVPANASVSATWYLTPHLAERKTVYVFPLPFKIVLNGMDWSSGELARRGESLQFLVVDATTPPGVSFGLSPAQMRGMALAHGFHTVLTRGPVSVYARR